MDKEKLIEQYFSGQISEEGFLKIKTLLEDDDTFKKEFYSQLEIHHVIAAEKRAPLKKRLKKLDRKPVRQIKWYAYAAAVALLIVVGILLYRPEPRLEKLYASHFEPYPNVIAPTIRDEDLGGDSKTVAFRYYDNRRYADAAIVFKQIYLADDEDYAAFYYAISLMAAGDTQEGVTVLASHVWTQPEDYQIIAHWYLGLGYLHLHNKEKAVSHLEMVGNSHHPKSKKAIEILRKIN